MRVHSCKERKDLKIGKLQRKSSNRTNADDSKSLSSILTTTLKKRITDIEIKLYTVQPEVPEVVSVFKTWKISQNLLTPRFHGATYCLYQKNVFQPSKYVIINTCGSGEKSASCVWSPKNGWSLVGMHSSVSLCRVSWKKQVFIPHKYSQWFSWLQTDGKKILKFFKTSALNLFYC